MSPRVYSAKTDRKVSMFMDAFHSVHEVFGWKHAVVWWHAADATLLRECWDASDLDQQAGKVWAYLQEHGASTRKEVAGGSASPEALDLRHAGHGRILNPDEDGREVRGYVRGDAP